jgi:hypothetical protein
MTINNSESNLIPRSKGLQTQPQVLDPIECTIRGEIPSWVKGVLYRAGPGTYDVDQVDGKKYEIQHWYVARNIKDRFSFSFDKTLTAFPIGSMAWLRSIDSKSKIMVFNTCLATQHRLWRSILDKVDIEE